MWTGPYLEIHSRLCDHFMLDHHTMDPQFSKWTGRIKHSEIIRQAEVSGYQICWLCLKPSLVRTCRGSADIEVVKCCDSQCEIELVSYR